MPTTRETILEALHALLQAQPAPVLRGEVLPERIPSAGLLTLRDGEQREPAVTLSPHRCSYQHRAEVAPAVTRRSKYLPLGWAPRSRPTCTFGAGATDPNPRPRGRLTWRLTARRH
jgi:hypothetical protein